MACNAYNTRSISIYTLYNSREVDRSYIFEYYYVHHLILLSCFILQKQAISHFIKYQLHYGPILDKKQTHLKMMAKMNISSIYLPFWEPILPILRVYFSLKNRPMYRSAILNMSEHIQAFKYPKLICIVYNINSCDFYFLLQVSTL